MGFATLVLPDEVPAAAALAGVGGNGPDLIYVPEIDFDLDVFTAKVKEIYAKQKKCFLPGTRHIWTQGWM